MRLLVVNRIGKDVENVIFHNYCGTTYSGLEVTDEFVRRLGLLYESRNEVNTLKMLLIQLAIVHLQERTQL